MTLGFDNVTATGIGTAVVETQLNGGASLRVPASAHGIMEVIPYQATSGATTVDEGILSTMRIDSDDVSVTPKRLVLPWIQTGDGAYTAVMCPVLKAYPMGIPLQGFERISYFGQAQVANTVQPLIGATVVYTEGGVGAQQYYQKPNDETTAGITANLRNSGNDITLTGGGMINALYLATGGNATYTASEHCYGFGEFVSSDFANTSMPYRVASQPDLAGLGATASELTGGAPGIAQYKLPPGQEIPLDSNVTINTFWTNVDVHTTSGYNFIHGVRYHR